jgi:hypothetical protein
MAMLEKRSRMLVALASVWRDGMPPLVPRPSSSAFSPWEAAISGTEFDLSTVNSKLIAYINVQWQGVPDIYAARLVELDVDAASVLAAQMQSMRDSQYYDVYHRPANWMFQKESDHAKEVIDRCDALRDALVRAGAKPPTSKSD